MSTTIHLTYNGMPGTGATVKQAKVDAGRHIEEALRRDYSPTLITWRGKLLVIMTSTQDIGYRIYEFDALPHVVHAYPCSCGFNSRDEALKAAVFHLADITRTAGEPVECQLPLYQSAFSPGDMDREWTRFMEHAEASDRFAGRYQLAKAHGLSDEAAHDFAAGPIQPRPALEALWLER